jgi:hypothetical protein
MIRIARRRGYVIQHVAGFVWTGSKWSGDKKKAMVYSSRSGLPRAVPGHGRESGISLHLSEVKSGTTYGTYHPNYGEARKGKNRKTRRSPHAYVRPAYDMDLLPGMTAI